MKEWAGKINQAQQGCSLNAIDSIAFNIGIQAGCDKPDGIARSALSGQTWRGDSRDASRQPPGSAASCGLRSRSICREICAVWAGSVAKACKEVQEIVRRDSIRNGYNTAQGGSIGTAKELTVDGRTFPSYVSAAAHYGVDPQVMAMRLGRLKWTPEESVGLVAKGWVGKAIPVTVADVVYPSMHQAAEAYKINYKLVHERVRRRGWTIEQALQISDAPDSSRFAGIGVSAFGLTFKSYGECTKHFGIKAPSLLKRLTEKQESIEEAIRYLQSKPKTGAQPKPISAFGVTYKSTTELAAQLGLSVKSIRNRMLLKRQTLEEAITKLQSFHKKTRPVS